MVFNFSKLLAWFIVFFGLAVIGWAVFSTYGFFSGKEDFPQVFKTPAETVQTQSASPKIDSSVKSQAEAQAVAQEQMQQAISENLSKVFPADAVSKFSNMTAWMAFATFMVFAGGQIAGVGVKLLASRA